MPDTDEENGKTDPNPLAIVSEHWGDTKLAPAHGIASIALSLAMKYHDINTVQDGTLYQQYKLEGRNMMPLHIDMVFETAIRIEMHLMASSDRIAKIVVDALVDGAEREAEEAEGAENAR